MAYAGIPCQTFADGCGTMVVSRKDMSQALPGYMTYHHDGLASSSTSSWSCGWTHAAVQYAVTRGSLDFSDFVSFRASLRAVPAGICDKGV